MARRPLTPSEQIVGRKLPPEASYRDQFLASFIGNDGAFCTRLEPGESWMRPAFFQARKKRMITLVDRWSICGGKPIGRYRLTESGEVAARAARAKCIQKRELRQQWVADLQAKQQAEKAKLETQEDPTP